MRVALDAQLTVGKATGIGEYARGLASALRARQIDVVELHEPSLDPWRFDRRLLWDQIILPRRARNARARLLHCTGGTMPLAVSLPVVVTVHDLAWHVVQSHARAYARYYFGTFSLTRYRRAARVLVDSNFTGDELLRLNDRIDASRVEVIYPGVAADFCTLPGRASDGSTVLCVGTIEPRKNLAVLIRALVHLKRARLVAVGPQTPYAAQCAQLAQELQVAERVEMLGYVDRAQLLALYAGCAVVAVPSYYEGFGYAAAQALCAGVPCVVSERSSLPEIAGGDARIVAADDPQAWARALHDALDGLQDVTAARARAGAITRFSWETSAQAVERAYASVDR